MIQLKTLEIQLDNLKHILHDAEQKERPLEEINEIRGKMKVVAILIEKRRAFIRRNQSLN